MTKLRRLHNRPKHSRPPVEPIQADAWYSARDLSHRYAVHVVTISKWVAAGRLAPAVKLAPGTARWRGATLLEHERARAAAGAK